MKGTGELTAGLNYEAEYNRARDELKKMHDENCLIANGVTFATDNNVGDKLTPTEPLTNCQHWIPVTERLPDNKEHDWVLAQVVEDNGYMHIPKVMEYRQALNDWYEETYGWLSKHNGAFSVTHWMPLPEPPKGE